MRLAGLVAPVLLVAAIGSTGWSGARLEQQRRAGPATRTGGEELLYLPNGRLLSVISLGHRSLLADAYYLWAIQYYADYEREGRYRYVEHVFDRVITELDPHYVDAYWLGALILILEAGELESGLRLLDKGAAANPDEWLLPYVAGWESYHAGQAQRGAAYMAKAAQVPGAPMVVRRMRAGMLSKAGNVETALALWQEVLDDPKSDRVSRAIAGRQVRDLTVRRDLDRLRVALERFRDRNGRPPRQLADLLEQGYIASWPTDPDGQPYRYEPETGRIWSPAGRVL